MPVLFDRDLGVYYGQFYVLAAGLANPELDDAFRGQANGLLGAASPGALWVTTGLHTGRVGLVVVRDVQPPAIETASEEIVEVSFRVPKGGVLLTEWAAGRTHPLDLPAGDWRVRLSATGMDAGQVQDTVLETESVIDRYTLAFWPAAPAADAIVKQSSVVAKYWHDWAATLRP
jgi:hypothetical protein